MPAAIASRGSVVVVPPKQGGKEKYPFSEGTALTRIMVGLAAIADMAAVMAAFVVIDGWIYRGGR